MPGRLLESTRRSQRSLPTTISSIVIHAAIIAFAIRATMNVTQQVVTPDPIVYHTSVELADPPGAQSQGSKATDKSLAAQPALPKLPATFKQATLIDVPTTITDALDDARSATKAALAAAGGSFGHGDFGSGVGQSKGFGLGHGFSPNGSVFSDGDVDRQAYMIPGTVDPQYPNTLRIAGIDGQVVAQFIVDTTEHVEPNSIVIQQATNPLFGAAVRAALLKGRFAPAEIGGHKVRQLVQQTFSFTIK